MILEGRVGPLTSADGGEEALRLSRDLAQVVGDGHGHFTEPSVRGSVFTLSLTATTTGIAAGNIVGAAAAASTQFALINPASSGKNLALLKFFMGYVSGTLAAGPLWHGYIPNAASISAASAGGTIRSNLLGSSSASVATPWALAAGSALTGGQAPVTFRMANWSQSAGAFADVAGNVTVTELLDGDLVIPPGAAWVPLHPAAGTSVLNGYSLTWEEVPV